ncbi:hypothetical protein [Bacillus subtilis]|uniref:hypothetical protein n=1 Tax=Bacillus subtilis TaxID=1423 RepID=UPI003F87B80F
MRQYTLSQIVERMERGLLPEGAVFCQNSTGDKMIYDGDSLRWLTVNNYISATVTITEEAIKDTFTLLTAQKKKLTMLEALPYIAEGKRVTIDMEHKQYTVDNLSELEDVIECHEFLVELYESAVYYVEEDETEKPSTVTAKTLSEGDVYNIHHLYHFVKKPVSEIAVEKGVSERMVYYILEGKRWDFVYRKFHSDYCIVKDDYIS